MTSVASAACAACTFVLAWIATFIVRRHALDNAILDIPNERSSHAAPTPRGGGLAIVASFLGSVAVLWLAGAIHPALAAALLAAGGSIAVAGYLDDRKTLSARVRICVHVIAASLAVALIGGIADQTLLRLGLHGLWAGSVLAVMALTWSTNLFNFMDGIDGIAASQAVFMAGAGAFLNWQYGTDTGLSMAMLMLAAASLGFLLWNWPPAKIFMGDVGSGFLGFALLALGLASSRAGAPPIEAWAILGGVFLVDATLTLLRRIVRGDRWFEAHRSHAYQNLASRWDSHLQVTLLVIAINVGWLLPWAWAASAQPQRALWYMASALLPLTLAMAWAGAGRAKPKALAPVLM